MHFFKVDASILRKRDEGRLDPDAHSVRLSIAEAEHAEAAKRAGQEKLPAIISHVIRPRNAVAC